MLKILFSLLLVCNLQQNSYAQNKETDMRAAAIPEANSVSVEALASYIKQNFTTEADRVRAIYIWITHHVNYDLPRLLAMGKNTGTMPQTVADVLSTRKAVCQGYSDLFIALCQGMGVNAIAISGYTKNQGKIAPVPHAWVAAVFDGEWYLFDPTWGAGYVRDEHFIKKFNNAFYKMSPASIIVDHMPFDPMYQFLSEPVSHREFIYGTKGNSKTVFNYNDSLKQYGQLSSIQQNAIELRRLEEAGVEHELIRLRQTYLKNRLQSFASKNSFDEGRKIFTTVVSVYKEYLGHKNKQFSTIGDKDLKQMVDSIEQNVKLSRSFVTDTKTKTDEQSQAKSNTLNNIDRFWEQLIKEKQFVEKYLATDKAARKPLFMKRVS